MDTLTKLAVKYKADKWGKHNYTPYYFSEFKKIRNKVKKILEIGAGEGASLRMWRDFFPNAMVYGADNQDNRIMKEDRIEVIKCDQSKLDDLISLVGKTSTDIDIVIDDGSHMPFDQVYSCRGLMYMLDNPLYYIEDVSDESIIDDLSSFEIEVKKFGKRYDDRIVKLTK